MNYYTRNLQKTGHVIDYILKSLIVEQGSYTKQIKINFLGIEFPSGSLKKVYGGGLSHLFTEETLISDLQYNRVKDLLIKSKWNF